MKKAYTVTIGYSQTDQPKFVVLTTKDKDAIKEHYTQVCKGAFWVDVYGPYEVREI